MEGIFLSCIVRKATLKDLPSILLELRDFDAFYGTKKGLYQNDEHTTMVVGDMIDNHVFLVSENDGLITGLMAGMLLPHLYNPDIKTLVETFWWVGPQYRGTRAGALLLREFTKYGKENVDWIICTIEANSPINEDVFLKRGFKLREKSFIMEV